MTEHNSSLHPIHQADTKDVQPILHVHVPDAGQGLGLLLQSGAGFDCLTGISLERWLLEELRLETPLRNKLDVYLLNGMPVDEPRLATVRNGCRLALAAGLPGIAGIAMRGGCPMAGLRPGITYVPEQNAQDVREAPGRIELALFCLALPLLGAHVLRRGVLVRARKLLPYLRPTLMESCIINERSITLEESRNTLAGLDAESLLLVTAVLR